MSRNNEYEQSILRDDPPGFFHAVPELIAELRNEQIFFL